MDKYEIRKFIIGAIIVMVAFIYASRLFYIQVIDRSYILSAENNSRRYVVKYPARGLIYDRNGKLIVYNEAAYDLMVIPGQVSEFDTTKLADLLGIDCEEAVQRLDKARIYNRYRPSIYMKQISAQRYAALQEVLHCFPGFFVQPRTLRAYPYKSAAHLLGYVGEVDKKIVDENPYYQQGDYIGISGVEKSYEEILRGQKGGEFYQVDVRGRIKGKLENGRYDTAAFVGKNLTLTIDIDLQNFGERLMQNKIGSVVAIEPSTGEILALLSSPGYDPSLLVGIPRTQNYAKLLADTLKPLFNRALMAQYPPGSTFKVLNALIGLQEGLINRNTRYGCNSGYYAGNFKVGCHQHRSPLDLVESIAMSCNAYYCNVFRGVLDNSKYGSVGVAYDSWRNHLLSMGLGNKTGSDFLNELAGSIPKRSYYDKIYGKNRWRSLTVISLGIGQGELAITPLQMANTTAMLANRGSFFTPHVVKAVEGQDRILPQYLVRRETTIDKNVFGPVIEGLHEVVQGGEGSTGRWSAIPGIEMCGKTGTAQNPHGEDHSIFIAFAPMDDPKIAIAVYVENSGFGSIWAAPIASMMIEQYLTDTVTKPAYFVQRILDGNLINAKTTKQN